MTTIPETSHLTAEQLDLIKNTVARGATPDELRLFLYRAKELGLDPLKPGQIHFVKYGSGPGTIVIGIEGFRAKAGSTGKHVGTKRGVVRDPTGRALGAWAEVYRSDWQHPAREEVSLAEYTTGRGPWLRMPETMIKKVAEVAALRMAFPEQLGGVYAPEEMEQAEAQGRDESDELLPAGASAAENAREESPAPRAPSPEPSTVDREAWKETRAIELGFANRREQVLAVRALQDDLAAFGISEEWAAERLAERKKKTLWALRPDEMREFHEAVRRAGERSRVDSAPGERRRVESEPSDRRRGDGEPPKRPRGGLSRAS
jgi:phage recombination protein Bet